MRAGRPEILPPGSHRSELRYWHDSATIMRFIPNPCMPTEILNRASKEIKQAEDLLNSGQEVSPANLNQIRESLSKLRQEITKHSGDVTEAAQRQELELRAGELQAIDDRIAQHIKEHEADNRPAANPTDEAMRKLETDAATHLERIPGPVRSLLRNIVAGMGSSVLTDWFDSFGDVTTIRDALRSGLQPQLAARLQESPRDRKAAANLRKAWRRKLLVERKTEDQLPFEQYIQDKIEEFTKTENDRLARNSNYRPARITVGSLLSLTPATAPRGANQTPDLSLREREELNRDRPMLQARHAKQIAEEFKQAMHGGNVFTIDPIPVAASTATASARETQLTQYRETLATRVCAALENPANKAKAYLKINPGEDTLREYDPIWFSEDDPVITGFRGKLRNNPIALYHELMNLNTGISGIGGKAKASLDLIKTNLTNGATGVDHRRGMTAIGATPQAAPTQQQTPPNAPQGQTTPPTNTPPPAANSGATTPQ